MRGTPRNEHGVLDVCEPDRVDGKANMSNEPMESALTAAGSSQEEPPFCPICRVSLTYGGWRGAKECSKWICPTCGRSIEISSFLPSEERKALVPSLPEVDSARRVVTAAGSSREGDAPQFGCVCGFATDSTIDLVAHVTKCRKAPRPAQDTVEAMTKHLPRYVNHEWVERKGEWHVYDCTQCGMWTANMPLYKNDRCEVASRSAAGSSAPPLDQEMKEPVTRVDSTSVTSRYEKDDR